MSGMCYNKLVVWYHLPLGKGYSMKAKKLPSGSYRVQVVAGFDEKGKRVVKSFTADTEWEAIRMAEQFKLTHEERTDKNVTVVRAMETYIANRENVIEKTTIRNYRQIAKYCFKCIHETKITTLRTVDVQRAVNLESARVSPKYVKNAFGFLKSVLKMYEVDIKLDNIQLPKLVKNEKDLPSFETVFSVIRGTAIELPCLLSVWLSLRIGEVVGLQFQDVDPEKHTIKVRRTIILTDEGYEVRERCKTEKSVRTLALPDYLFQMIMAIPHRNGTEHIVKLTRKAVYSRFKRMMIKHGYPDLTYHDLRHLNASVMLMLGVPDKYAMERGGWSTDHILKNVYQQTFSDERKRVDEVIDDYFNGIIQNGQSA